MSPDRFATGIVKWKRKICIENLLLDRSYSPFAIHPVLETDNVRVHDTFHMVYGSTGNGHGAKAWSSKRFLHDNNNSNDDNSWEAVIYPLWVDSKYGLRTHGGEIISMDGLMGLCFNKCSNRHLQTAIDRVVLQYISAAHDVVVNNHGKMLCVF